MLSKTHLLGNTRLIYPAQSYICTLKEMIQCSCDFELLNRVMFHFIGGHIWVHLVLNLLFKEVLKLSYEICREIKELFSYSQCDDRWFRYKSANQVFTISCWCGRSYSYAQALVSSFSAYLRNLFVQHNIKINMIDVTPSCLTSNLYAHITSAEP